MAEGVPSRPNTFYFGAAGGGVWKTTDAGRTWQGLMQHEAASAVGALAVAPSDPDILYVGTGQVAARYDIAAGDGVYRSSDAGEDVDERRASARRTTSAASSSIRTIPTACSWRRWATSSARTPSAASI